MSEPRCADAVGLGRSAEQEQFGAALHELLSAADVPGAARAWAAGDRAPGLRGVAAAGRARRHRAGRAGTLRRPRGQPARPGGRVRGTRASRAARAGGRVAGGGSGAAGRAGRDRPRPAGLGGPRARAGWPGWRPANCSARWPRRPGCRTRWTPTRPAWCCWPSAARCGWPRRAPGTGRWTAPAGWPRCTADRAAGPRTGGRGGATGRSQLGTLASAAQLLGAGRALLEASVRHASAAGPVRPADRQLPGGQASAGRRGHRAGVRPAAAGRGRRRGRRPAPAAEPAGTCPRPRSPAPTPRTGRPAPRCRCTGRSATPSEHDLSLWLAKVRALVPAWGSQAEHRAVVLAAVTAAADGGEAGDRTPRRPGCRA